MFSCSQRGNPIEATIIGLANCPPEISADRAVIKQFIAALRPRIRCDAGADASVEWAAAHAAMQTPTPPHYRRNSIFELFIGHQ